MSVSFPFDHSAYLLPHERTLSLEEVRERTQKRINSREKIGELDEKISRLTLEIGRMEQCDAKSSFEQKKLGNFRSRLLKLKVDRALQKGDIEKLNAISSFLNLSSTSSLSSSLGAVPSSQPVQQVPLPSSSFPLVQLAQASSSSSSSSSPSVTVPFSQPVQQVSLPSLSSPSIQLTQASSSSSSVSSLSVKDSSSSSPVTLTQSVLNYLKHDCAQFDKLFNFSDRISVVLGLEDSGMNKLKQENLFRAEGDRLSQICLLTIQTYFISQPQVYLSVATSFQKNLEQVSKGKLSKDNFDKMNDFLITLKCLQGNMKVAHIRYTENCVRKVITIINRMKDIPNGQLDVSEYAELLEIAIENVKAPWVMSGVRELEDLPSKVKAFLTAIKKE